MMLSYCISNSNFSMLVYTKAIDLCSATLLYLTISSRFCMHVNFFGILYRDNHLICKQSQFYSFPNSQFYSFPTLNFIFFFFFFFFFLVLSVPSSAVLDKNSERERLPLVSDSRRKVCKFSAVNMIQATVFLIDFLPHFEDVPISSALGNFT